MTRAAGEPFFGRNIPFLKLLGARAEHREKGRAVVSIEIRPELTNSWKFAHGGVLLTLLDVSMGSAARTTDAQNFGIVTVSLTVNFLRACSGLLRAEGRVLRSGRSLVFCEGEVRDASGEVIAKGIGTFRLKKAD
jgi:uncharacterized protein (TIGR00369 family)